MTILRRVWAFLFPIVVCRPAPPTIAEMKKDTLPKLPWRTPTRTYEADPEKLRGSRAGGKVKSVADWHAKHGHRRSA